MTEKETAPHVRRGRTHTLAPPQQARKRLLAMAARLDQWAEITALALELRKSVLALKKNREWAEANVWREIREMKEKAWTTNHS